MPLVSVLMPARDAAVTIEAALRSVGRQTLTDWECLVIDDGSADATLMIAQRFAAADARFHVVPSPRRGLVSALGAGLARCHGRYVARMDADDLMHRHRLAAQTAWLARDDSLAGVGCHVRLFPRVSLRDGLRAYERWLNGVRSADDVAREAFVECPLAHPTLMIRREIAAAFGYRDLDWPEDYDLVLRLLAAGERIGIVPRRLLAWRDGPTRLTRVGSAYAQDRIVACKAAFLASGFLAGGNDYVLWGFGGTGRALRAALAAHGKHPSHVVEVHPGRLGNTIHGAMVIPHTTLASLRGARVVVSVAGAAPRRQIRAALRDMALQELRDFVCAA